MRITIAPDAKGLARQAADIVSEIVGQQPAATIGLPSGKTPLCLYDELARRARGGALDLSGVTAFAIDEWHGVAAAHPATNASYFHRNVTQRMRLRALHVMDSAAENPEEECARFQRLLEASGGLDLVILGVGLNGHIAFNEPGSGFDSRARRVALARVSREAHAASFGSLETVPAFGLTLGIADLLAARRALLMAIGADKATVVAQALNGPVTEALPASALRRHPALTVLLDEEAAARLEGKRA